MFGYVTINKPELKMKDFARYKAYYCGLCHVLKDKYGRVGQMTLTYDMTFLIILLTSLYESDTKIMKNRCLTQPFKQHEELTNEVSSYGADMNIVLSYYHFVDDWKDEKSKKGLVGARVLLKDFIKIKEKYPRQCKSIKKSLRRLHKCEVRGEESIDLIAGCFGELMAELFIYKEDQWELTLRKMGFYLGKFIYIMDAYDDVEKDIKNSSFNPLASLYGKPDFEENVRQMLIMMMAECTNEFEKLPCVEEIDILRNILYAGVWSRMNTIHKERIEKKEEKTNDSRSL